MNTIIKGQIAIVRGFHLLAFLFLVNYAAVLGVQASLELTKETLKLEGRWKVVSVEIAGAAVPGFAGASLMLKDGRKEFTLPDGRIEKGTYQLNGLREPGEINATTDGRSGTEKGIYAVEGNVLKLCLATGGGERPQNFTTRQGGDQLLIILKREIEKTVEKIQASNPVPISIPNPTGSRAFRMGFTGFVYDTTLEAVTASRKFVRENGDILAHHIEGVPWTESLKKQPYSQAMLNEWKGKKSATPSGGKVYLAISPGRGNLKLAEKASPLTKELKGMEYDSPLVMEAYLSYCRRAIDFFHPDYLSIGIEVNEIHDAGAKKWQAYVALHKYVYQALKKDHPQLHIFASWTLHNMFKKRGQMLEEFQKLMPFNDLVAVSYYPFFMEDKDRLRALDWMLEQFDSLDKPYAMVETNDAAERLPLPQAQVIIEGSPEKQLAYYSKLLSLAQQRDFAFVISFVHQDYDVLWKKIKAQSPELFIAWKDCGFLDENGKARPAFEVWKKFFYLPIRK